MGDDMVHGSSADGTLSYEEEEEEAQGVRGWNFFKFASCRQKIN